MHVPGTLFAVFLVDFITVGEQYAAEGFEHLANHLLGPRGCEGEGSFVVVPVPRPDYSALHDGKLERQFDLGGDKRELGIREKDGFL